MAIYHFSAKVISRANGSSAVAAAAYRSACRLEDVRLGRAHDFTNKSGVVHSEILAPEGAPAHWLDREALWNAVEAGEARKDAQLAREVEFAIPREMNVSQGVELARDFVRATFVDRGMVADLNVHWDIGPDGLAKPHAHVMLSMRAASPDGFGKKVREWNSSELLSDWRGRWADHVNTRLAELDIDARVDHRTLAAQGIVLEPQHKIGAAALRRLERNEGRRLGGDFESDERVAEHREIARRNGERLIAEPELALGAITRQQSTFTDHDLARFIHRHTDDAEQFSRALSAVKGSSALVALGRDGRGRERFSTRDMLETEQRLERVAARLAHRQGHVVSPVISQRPPAGDGRPELVLGKEQLGALAHVAGAGDLAIIVGYAGAGKSAMLGVAREAWEASGYEVRGASLSGIAAESLEAGSGIGSRTIASLEHSWGQGRDLLTSRDVLVIDEAGMVGSRQMERVLAAADRAGAKVVLVGDVEQLQAIEAGAAFRALSERHGAAEITEIRRQRTDWQRAATRELATERTEAALERYEVAGMVHGHESREAARSALVGGWNAVREARPEASQVMLAHTRADVAELNQLARVKMREGGALRGEDRVLRTERGERAFAAGDRVMFLRNERSLGVKNGTLGTVETLNGQSLVVRLDDRPAGARHEVRFDLKDFAHIDHGYAATIHKSQGVTVDHSHVLVSDGLDRHGAYVGMSRHRDSLALHYGADDFKDRAHLVRTLSRERAKDTTLDYDLETFAERRGFGMPQMQVQGGVTRPRSMFDGLKLQSPSVAERAGAPLSEVGGELGRAVERYARAWSDDARMRNEDLPLLEHQKLALSRAGRALEAQRPGAVQDFAEAVFYQPDMRQALAEPAGPGRSQRLIAGVELEARMRRAPALKAERLVGVWRGLEAERDGLGGFAQAEARSSVEGRMRALVGTLKRDSQLEALMRTRSRELGIGPGSRLDQIMKAPTIDQAIVRALGRDLGLSR